MSDPVGPVDHRQRQHALDVTASFIIQAPAGSGKTELLIQRILALLAVVNQPEELLAITFTRKAAAEMHKRLLEALELAHSGAAPAQPHQLLTWALAQAALSRDRESGWQLLDNPSRLQVLTIDSFNASLVRRMPYLARFGEVPAIAEDPVILYRDAVERLLARLERGEAGAAAIERLLLHLDNRVPLLRDLVVAMLGRRDQWLRHLDPVDLESTRGDLEQALFLQVHASLTTLRSSLSDDLLVELSDLGSWAAGNLPADGEGNLLAALLGRSSPPDAVPDDLSAWLALANLVLTKDGNLRKTVNKTIGFPAGGSLVDRQRKERLADALARLRAMPAAVLAFQELRYLPALTYAESQWQVLAALIELLPLADRELRETFRARRQVDFVEIARGALAALGDDLAPGELLLSLDSRLRHILVDEFQDTSRGQYELLNRVTAGWELADGRTLFLVGDPMQSIYRFREAEVGLFLQVRASGLETVRLTPLVLQANFRSQAALVAWINTTFAALFPVVEDAVRGAVPYSPAMAVRDTEPGAAVTLTCFSRRDDAVEARHIVALIRQAQADDPAGTVAVLVRSRAHLTALAAVLMDAGIAWQAQEVVMLSNRPVIRDLLALTRALLHPADRIAWLSILRAPWCGLCLNDLLLLCGGQAEVPIWECLAGRDGQLPLLPVLSTEEQGRLSRVVTILGNTLASKGRVPLRRLVEAAWVGLNGPAGLEVADLDDAEQFLTLLEELDEGGDLVSFAILEERLAKLYAAPNPEAGPGLQLMTIHKAKGLEFDTVILPGLGRSVRAPERPLLLWQEALEPSRRGEGLLLAPIPATASDDQGEIYRAISRIHAEKDRLETLRLFYVAATRARRRLHLLGHAERSQDGVPVPAPGSLLKAAWPALADAVMENLVEPAPVQSLPVTRGVPLCRLPPGWSAPELVASLPATGPTMRRATDAGPQSVRRGRLSLRRDEGRIVGTVVHGWLERLARDGLGQWPEQRVADSRSMLQLELLQGGVPRSRVAAGAERALTALLSTLRSPRGRWLLQEHRDAACELAMTGVIDGVVVNAVIDRTFIDEYGVRWVVDYKCAEPEEGEPLEEFLAAEAGRYRGQLDSYRRLMLQGATSPVNGALYFPLLDIWSEVLA